MQTTLAQFNETQSQEAFALQNSKLLKVRLGLGHDPGQGRLDGRLPGRGHLRARRLGRHRPDDQEGDDGRGHDADEDGGQGEVFLADQAQEIHLIYLENDFITVNGPQPARVRRRHRLGHQARLGRRARRRWPAACSTWSCAARAGSRSSPTARPCCSTSPSAPTFADAQAAITWSSGVTTAIKTDFKMKNLIGRGSGESIQMAFTGQGWVLVQPSEGRVIAPAAVRRRAGQPARRLGSDVDDVAVAGLVHDHLAARAPPARLERRAAGARGAAARRRRRRGRPSRPAGAARRPARGRARSARRRSAAGARSTGARRPAPAR